jgi:hypothetical protein
MWCPRTESNREPWDYERSNGVIQQCPPGSILISLRLLEVAVLTAKVHLDPPALQSTLLSGPRLSHSPCGGWALPPSSAQLSSRLLLARAPLPAPSSAFPRAWPLASAQAFFRRVRATAEAQPAAIVTDHHQPYVRAAQQNCPARSTFGPASIVWQARPPNRSSAATSRPAIDFEPLEVLRLRRPVSDSWKASRRCRRCAEGMSLCAVWCRATGPLGHSQRPCARRGRCHGHLGSRAEQGGLTVDPRSVIAP